jgi:putative transposase
VPLQQSLRHLDRAFKNFFQGRAHFPRFKSRRARQSAHYMRNAFSLKESGVRGTPLVLLAKMDAPLRIRWSRRLPSDPSSLVVTRDGAGRYFISFRVDIQAERLPPSDRAVGIDLGISDAVVTSNGKKYGNPRFLNKGLDRLCRAQRRLSRKRKGSANYERQRRRLARIHARIRERRQDFVHQLSTRLIRENQTICLETLHVRNMVKNRRLARAISDVAWSELVRQLSYKALWYGRDIVRIDPWYPSTKTCSVCGHAVERMPLAKRQWRCDACGSAHDRDVNAARNILAVGTTVVASGGRVRPDVDRARRRSTPFQPAPTAEGFAR